MPKTMSELSQSQEYISFRSSIPLKRIFVDNNSKKGWKIYDSGPKSIRNPLICLPPVSGTADVYFRQILSLSAKGFRVISAEHPIYWTIDDWCAGFKKLLNILSLDKVHLFGASLGGFLAQKFAEYTSNCPQVISLILCNTFTDTSVFKCHDSSPFFWVTPALVLKKMILANFTPEHQDIRIIKAVDFMVERTKAHGYVKFLHSNSLLAIKWNDKREVYILTNIHQPKMLDSLSQQDLACRLTMNCINSYVEPQQLSHLEGVTIIDVFDEYALSIPVREEMYKCYPNAKLAHLKSGGNFPYLSRSDEVNLHLQIHLRKFDGTEVSARETVP